MNSDSATNILFNELAHLLSHTIPAETPSSALVLLDENAVNNLAELQNIASQHTIIALSNRYDITTQANKLGINTYFNDFDFSQPEALTTEIGNTTLFAYRVSKEKPVTHHVLNQLCKLITPHTTLLISGKKNDGIKSYTENVKKIFHLEGELKKHGDDYIATLQVKKQQINSKSSHSHNPSDEKLNDSDYFVLREISQIEFLTTSNTHPFTLYSKPGVFGWNKIDQGSRFLTETLTDLKTHSLTGSFPHIHETIRALDLGCGYGYLSLFAASLDIKNITATDNNAAAILAIGKTAKENNLNIDVIPDDCGASITEKFDVIFCNPPFHQGFDIDSNLTEKFVATAKNRLSTHGKAYFVTNAFIAIEKLANKHFKSCKQLANNKKFKVLELSNK